MVDGRVCASCKNCKHNDGSRCDGPCLSCWNYCNWEPYKLSDGVLMHVGDKTCKNCKHSIGSVFCACIVCRNHNHWEELVVVDQNDERVFYAGIDTGEKKMDKKVYVIEKEGYSHICAKLTENEARTLMKFLDWACLDETVTVTPAEEYVYEEWGEKE